VARRRSCAHRAHHPAPPRTPQGGSPDTPRPGTIHELSFEGDQCTIKHPAFLLANSFTTELLSNYAKSGDARTIALANSPVAEGLSYLNIYHNKIGPPGAKALASSPHLAKLRKLDIGYI
jgi:hypothetical protein